MTSELYPIPEQTELDAFVYDFHLQSIVRYHQRSDEPSIFPPEFSLIGFLQEFIEYYPDAPIGSRTALFKSRHSFFTVNFKRNFLFLILATIHHHFDGTKRLADNFLFKYVLEHAATYNIQIRKRSSVRISLSIRKLLILFIFRMNISTIVN